MGRYRFEVISPEYFPDPDGVRVSRAAVDREAASLAQALVRDYPEVFQPTAVWIMRVVDDAGQVVARFDMRALLDGPAQRTGA